MLGFPFRYPKYKISPRTREQKIPGTGSGNNSDCSKHPAHRIPTRSYHYFWRKKVRGDYENPAKR